MAALSSRVQASKPGAALAQPAPHQRSGLISLPPQVLALLRTMLKEKENALLSKVCRFFAGREVVQHGLIQLRGEMKREMHTIFRFVGDNFEAPEILLSSGQLAVDVLITTITYENYSDVIDQLRGTLFYLSGFLDRGQFLKLSSAFKKMELNHMQKIIGDVLKLSGQLRRNDPQMLAHVAANLHNEKRKAELQQVLEMLPDFYKFQVTLCHVRELCNNLNSRKVFDEVLEIAAAESDEDQARTIYGIITRTLKKQERMHEVLEVISLIRDEELRDALLEVNGLS